MIEVKSELSGPQFLTITKSRYQWNQTIEHVTKSNTRMSEWIRWVLPVRETGQVGE